MSLRIIKSLINVSVRSVLIINQLIIPEIIFTLT